MATTPFLKWAGGKRWLTARGIINVPKTIDRYVEPFLGSGALFFSQSTPSSLISDLNSDLINCYKVIAREPFALEAALREHNKRHNREYYYHVRSSEPIEPVGRAARFIYLNRTCWNGLYRVNRRGLFNVPIGTKSAVILDTDDFEQVSAHLKNTDIRCCDFAETISEAGAGDYLFVDPPYTVAHNHNGFIKYNETIFSWSDQIRLAEACYGAHQRGAIVTVTNADHPSVRSLYERVAHVSAIDRPSIISGNAVGRRVTTELLITFPAA